VSALRLAQSPPHGGHQGPAGLIHCRDCPCQYSVTVGTVFERKVPLHKWVVATNLLSSSKKGISAHQLHCLLDAQYKTAWFMAHRIREAMVLIDTGPMGGGGTMIEADETDFGRVPGNSRKATLPANHLKNSSGSPYAISTGIAANI